MPTPNHFDFTMTVTKFQWHQIRAALVLAESNKRREAADALVAANQHQLLIAMLDQECNQQYKEFKDNYPA